MEKLILNDFTEIEIQEGASLENITATLKDYDALAVLNGKLTQENLKKVKFMSGEEVSAEYTNMLLAEPNFRITKRTDALEVSFGLRERTQEEEQQESVEKAITYLNDEQALAVKDLYLLWDDDPEGYPYKMENPKDNRRRHQEKLWKLKKDHNKQEDWYPGAEGTLWEEIMEGHAGTLEDPIPVPDTVTTSGFTYVYGKYYIEGEEIYLCKRAGVENPEEMYGQEETLYYAPSAMVGQYFEKVG